MHTIIPYGKLIVALFLAIDNARYENHAEQLQEANTALKEQAKEIMKQSNAVSAVLKTKELDDIEKALSNYDTMLQDAQRFISDGSIQLGIENSQESQR